MTGTQLGTVGLLVVFPVLGAIVGAVLFAGPPTWRPANERSAALRRRRDARRDRARCAGRLSINRATSVLRLPGFAVGTAVLLGLRQLEAHAGTAAHARQAKGDPGRAQRRHPRPGAGRGADHRPDLGDRPAGAVGERGAFQPGRRRNQGRTDPAALSLGLVIGAIGAVVVLGSAPAALLRRPPRLWPRGAAVPRRRGTARRGSRDRRSTAAAAMLFVGFFALYILDASQ